MSDNNNIFSSVFATDGNLVFSFTEYGELKLLDIRKYYKDKNTKEFKPTTKGISVTPKGYNTVKNILEHYDDKIKAWLESSSEVVIQRQKNLEKEIFSPIAVKADVDAWKSPEFFEVEPAGGENIVIYNSKSSFYKILTETLENIAQKNPSEAEKIKTLFDMMLSSFNQAKNLLDETGKNEQIMDALMYNWGIILSNALK